MPTAFRADKKGPLSPASGYSGKRQGLVQFFFPRCFIAAGTPPDEPEMQFNMLRVDGLDPNRTPELAPPKTDPGRLAGIRQQRDQTCDVERPAVGNRFVRHCSFPPQDLRPAYRN